MKNDKEKLLSRIVAVKNDKRELERRIEEAERDRQELQARIEDLQRDKQDMQSRTEDLKKERQELEDMVSTLGEKNRALRKSVTFRVGQAMVTAVRPSRATITLPFRLWRIYREYRSQERQRRQRRSADEGSGANQKHQRFLLARHRPARAKATTPQTRRGESEELVKASEVRDKLAHLALREVMKADTDRAGDNSVGKASGVEQSSDEESTKGVSIITCTNKPHYMKDIFANFDRQRYAPKELIIILNNNSLNIDEWIAQATRYQNAAVYRVDEQEGLGDCLNSGVAKARFDHIAKFDDDDYYAPAYLEDMMSAFHHSEADVVGKWTIYVYIEARKSLFKWHPGSEHCFVPRVAGSTIMVRRRVFEKVSFASGKGQGRDTQFLKDCGANGLRIYSADRFNHVVIRRASKGLHTWKFADDDIIKRAQMIAYIGNYITHITC